ncbi:MAG: hypothetical protein ACSHYB_02525 [Roseibacillus sp.]
MSALEPLTDNVFLQRHPLSIAGAQFGRNITVVRLSSGKLLIHSTADFTEEDAQAISELGEPAWLLEATLYHDTFAKEGRAAFPDIPYLVPKKFPEAESLNAQTLTPQNAPNEWARELEVIPIKGAPKLNELALYHSPSKTLILADLIFNLPPTTKGWTRFFLRALSGIKVYPGMSRLLKLCIKDREAFTHSLQQIADLDFEHIIVAHGDPILTDAKSKFIQAISQAGFQVSPEKTS